MPTNIPFDLDAASDLTDLSIQKIWIKSKADLKEYHREYYYVEPVTDYIVKDSSVTSIDAFSKIAENQIIPAASPYQGFDKTYTQSFFSGMLRITRPMWRYGIKARKLEAIVTELRNNSVRFKEEVLANLFDNMANTSYTETQGKFSFTVTSSGGDGVSGKSTAHTREDAGTNWNNEITDGTTVNMDFDYDGLKASYKTAQAIKGGVGEVLDVNLSHVLCKKESSVHHKSQEILNGLKRGEQPNTANRNSVINNTYMITANPYFSNDAFWGMIDTSMIGPKYGYQIKEGMPLTLDPQFIDYDTKEIKYSAGYDFDFGFNDARNLVLSDGTNS